ncbi:MAG: ABC transporter permease [Candidatus Sumerlaeia bacterium]
MPSTGAPKSPNKSDAPAASTSPVCRRNIGVFIGLVLLFGIWAVGAHISGHIAMASPSETFRALGKLVLSPSFHEHFWISLMRIMVSIAAAGAIGFALGIAAGLNDDIHNILEPLRWTAMSIPPVSLLVLAMLFMGAGTQMVVVFAGIILSPIIYINTVKGMQLVDRDMIEVARLYRFPLLMRIVHLYIPAVAAPLLAGMVQVVCSGVRVVILAELVGTSEGIGAEIQAANINLNMPVLYAWIFLSVAIVAGFEYLLLRPLQNHLLKWNRP